MKASSRNNLGLDGKCSVFDGGIALALVGSLQVQQSLRYHFGNGAHRDLLRVTYSGSSPFDVTGDRPSSVKDGEPDLART